MMTLFTEHWVMISMITFTLTLSDYILKINIIKVTILAKLNKLLRYYFHYLMYIEYNNILY